MSLPNTVVRCQGFSKGDIAPKKLCAKRHSCRRYLDLNHADDKTHVVRYYCDNAYQYYWPRIGHGD